MFFEKMSSARLSRQLRLNDRLLVGVVYCGMVRTLMIVIRPEMQISQSSTWCNNGVKGRPRRLASGIGSIKICPRHPFLTPLLSSDDNYYIFLSTTIPTSTSWSGTSKHAHSTCCLPQNRWLNLIGSALMQVDSVLRLKVAWSE